MLPGGDDTIVAVATAPGRGAVAIVRMSGARAIPIARALGAFGGARNDHDGHPVTARRAALVSLSDPVSGGRLDDALVTAFVAPNSYTGEDVVELATHGGDVSPTLVMAACVAAGARPALPGEFTRRAVLNGRMDLLQAEAVADLVEARTQAMQQQALAQLDGGLSRRLLSLRDDVIHLEALLAYDIDFPEEDDGPIAPARIGGAAQALLTALNDLLQTAPRGAMVRDGVLVVIAGPPNAGKSSLFNALLGEARAIVTAVPGTTRDAIEALLDRGGALPLRLVDTAGLRETDDEVEKLGIEVSGRYLAQAQVVLACGASPEDVARTVDVVRQRTAASVIAVHTKGDLRDTDGRHGHGHGITVSAESGAGLAALLDRIGAAAEEALPASPHDRVIITRERHRQGLTTAREEVAEFVRVWESGALPAPVAAVHLLTAREAISELIGSVDTDDILDRVFRDFCIGK